MQPFDIFLLAMSITAVLVFFALYRVDAGYGKFFDRKWGPAISNKVGWVLMESPVFVAMILLWAFSDRRADVTRLVFLFLFELHYFHRSFIFPFLIRGKGRMPLSIIGMGALFNTLNALMQGGWIFYKSPETMYTTEWLTSLPFIAGTLIFAAGMFINMESDSIIRNLRKPGDHKHYLPTKGMFRYVSSANYFGEFLEWVGFAVLTWSAAGAVFALWTFANLAPRAARIHERYANEFPQFKPKKVKRIIPFIY